MKAPTDIAFGIDLAGYATGKSVCAVAQEYGTDIEITILTECPFSERQDRRDPIVTILRKEIEFLRKITKHRVAVDIPIDFQNLFSQQGVTQIWQLTQRPVDYALGALCPLADRIGSPAARFRNIVSSGSLEGLLGVHLFETYPAGSLKKLGLPHKGYKGPESIASEKRRKILTALHVASELNDDELDAMICAITALSGYQLRDADLGARLNLQPHALPNGYVLLKQIPIGRVAVQHKAAADWLQ